ncbi:MAG: hypothetical protein RLZZ536_464 [Planctomycetota bacterium]
MKAAGFSVFQFLVFSFQWTVADGSCAGVPGLTQRAADSCFLCGLFAANEGGSAGWWQENPPGECDWSGVEWAVDEVEESAEAGHESGGVFASDVAFDE